MKTVMLIPNIHPVWTVRLEFSDPAPQHLPHLTRSTDLKSRKAPMPLGRVCVTARRVGPDISRRRFLSQKCRGKVYITAASPSQARLKASHGERAVMSPGD